MDSVKVSPAEGEITAVTPQDPVLSTAEGVAGDRDVPKVRNKLQLFAIVVALYLSLFIGALDQTIVATAIPTIVDDLHGSSGFVWIGGAYLLANAAACPIWASVSDIWGRKPVLISVVVLFAASSIVCGSAKNMTALIVGRAFQGTAGAGLNQLVFITLSDIFSLRRRALFIGLTEVMWAIASGIGPIVGGAFAQLVTWRWSFWINLPMCGTTLVLLILFLDVHDPRTGILDGIKAVDWFGSFSILGLTLMLLIGLNFGGEVFPWDSPKVICLIVFGALMSLLFVFSEKKLAKYPLMPPSVFEHRSNIGALLVTFFHGISFIGLEYYLPLYFQSVRSASPLQSGILILPCIVTTALLGIASGVIIHRTGRYLGLIYFGVVVLTIGIGLLCLLDAKSSLGMVIGLQIIVGIGSGLLFQPPLIALQAMVRQEDVASATGTLGFARNLATALGVVIGGVIFQNGMNDRSSALIAAGLPSNLADDFSGRNADASVIAISGVANPEWKFAIKSAYAWSLQHLWIFYCCTAACGLISSMFIVKAKLSTEHTETRTGLAEKPQAPSTGNEVEMN